jgi:hypothetical protein
MVIPVQCGGDRVFALGELAQVEPRAVNPRFLVAVDVEVDVTLAVDILRPGFVWRELEVGRHKVQAGRVDRQATRELISPIHVRRVNTVISLLKK